MYRRCSAAALAPPAASRTTRALMTTRRASGRWASARKGPAAPRRRTPPASPTRASTAWRNDPERPWTPRRVRFPMRGRKIGKSSDESKLAPPFWLSDQRLIVVVAQRHPRVMSINDHNFQDIHKSDAGPLSCPPLFAPGRYTSRTSDFVFVNQCCERLRVTSRNTTFAHVPRHPCGSYLRCRRRIITNSLDRG